MKISLTNDTVCPRSIDPFYRVIYYIKWVTTSRTYSIYPILPMGENISLWQSSTVERTLWFHVGSGSLAASTKILLL